MNIIDMQGNLLASYAQALVNTVNTVGVMGKGIALSFKKAFPDNYRQYVTACKDGQVRTGRMFVTERNTLFNPQYIINFPTKQHWINPSRIDWINEGLKDLCSVIIEKDIRSIAIPPLGCGNGGLSWMVVKPLILKSLSGCSDLTVFLYEPNVAYI